MSCINISRLKSLVVYLGSCTNYNIFLMGTYNNFTKFGNDNDSNLIKCHRSINFYLLLFKNSLRSILQVARIVYDVYAKYQ